MFSFRRQFRQGFLAFAFALACLHGRAAVRQIEVTQRFPISSGASFGDTGPYECIAGRVHFAVDPELAPNRIVADLELAPRD